MSRHQSGYRATAAESMASILSDHVVRLRLGESPGIEATVRQVGDAAEAFPATLQRIGNLFLLSGIAGTMLALFRFAIEMQANLKGTVSPKQFLINSFGDAFSAFAVTIFGVLFAAVAFLAAHILRSRLATDMQGLAVELRQAESEASKDAVRPEALLARDLQATLASLTDVLQASASETKASLDLLNKDLGSRLAPLGRFEEIFGALNTSVNQMTKFVKGKGELVDTLTELRQAAEGLRTTAQSLPQAYRDHTITAITELKGFSLDSEQAIERINQNIGHIAHYIGDIPGRVKVILEGSLEQYGEATLGAFQTHLERVERIGERARSQLPEVESALANIDQRAVQTGSAIDDLTAKVGNSLSRLEQAADRLAGHAARAASAEDEHPRQPASGRWLVPVFVVCVAGAALGAPLLDRALQAWSAVPAPVSGDFRLRHASGDRAILAPPGGQAVTVTVGDSIGADGKVVVGIGPEFALLRGQDGATRTIFAEGSVYATVQLDAEQLGAVAGALDARRVRSERLRQLAKITTSLNPCSTAAEVLVKVPAELVLDSDPAVAALAAATLSSVDPACIKLPLLRQQVGAVLQVSPLVVRRALIRSPALQPICSDLPWKQLDALISAAESDRQTDLLEAAGRCKALDRVATTRELACAGHAAGSVWCPPPASDGVLPPGPAQPGSDPQGNALTP